MTRQENQPDSLTAQPARRASTNAAAAPPRARPASAGPGLGNIASHAIRVLCVDDHAVLVEGLRAQFAISGAVEVVGRLATASKLLEEVERLRPDAVLLDVEMPGPDVFEMADRLKREHPEVRVVVLSAHIRDALIAASFSSGASGYFAKSDELDDIEKGIREIMSTKSGAFVLGPKVRERCRPPSTSRSPKLTGTSAEVTDSGAPMTLLTSLTPRETEILRLIGRGLTRTQIAAQLCRSVKTVDGHQERLMKKLGIPARADLIRFAIREGLAQV